MKLLLLFGFVVAAWAEGPTPGGRAPVARMPLRPPPDVLRGQKVQVTVRSGAVLLNFEAEAQSTGRAGETVIVLNPESKRRFVARVEEKGKVLVQK
ncbi:MAG TPA: flagella basal body P-ring formation protein FlgA [Bryobacteraceae bacterium]|jgi:flagella basal body P-ring formation protein FlgA